MSQRLIKPGLRHPHTGALIQALGYKRNGDPIWPVLGAAPDDDGDPGGDDTPPDDDDADDADDDEGDDDSKPSKKPKKTGSDDDDDETVPKWKLDKLDRRMRAADQRASSLQKELDDLRATKDITPEIKREIEELRAKVGPLEKDRDQLRLHVAFLTNNTIKWKDPEAALKLADLSEVEFDDKGRVDKRALKAALKDLAASKAYLVADEDEDDKDTKDTTPPTTTPSNGKRKGAKTTPDRASLAQRFPVLNQIQ
jgi:hypothetical protein